MAVSSAVQLSINQIQPLVNSAFLPIYFSLAGLKCDLTALNTWHHIQMLLLVTIVAFSSKALGSSIPSYFLCKMNFRDSLLLSVLLNTRGLMEIVVLNIALDSDIINTSTYTIFLVMTLLSTLITSPLVDWINKEYSNDSTRMPNSVVTPSRTSPLSSLLQAYATVLRSPHSNMDFSGLHTNITIFFCQVSGNYVDVLKMVALLSPSVSPYQLKVTFLLPTTCKQRYREKAQSLNGEPMLFENKALITRCCSIVGVQHEFLDYTRVQNCVFETETLIALQTPSFVLIPIAEISFQDVALIRSMISSSQVPVAISSEPVRFDYDSSSGRDVSKRNNVGQILVLVVGVQADVYVLSTVQYIAFHKPNMQITILTAFNCHDVSNVSYEVVQMVRQLEAHVSTRVLRGIEIRNVYNPSMSTVSSLIMECSLYSHADLVMCSHIRYQNASNMSDATCHQTVVYPSSDACECYPTPSAPPYETKTFHEVSNPLGDASQVSSMSELLGVVGSAFYHQKTVIAFHLPFQENRK